MASLNGLFIAEGVDAEPFLPDDEWGQYVSMNPDVYSFHTPIEIPYRPVCLSWGDASYTSVFEEAIECTDGGFYESTSSLTLSLLSPFGFDQFKHHATRLIQSCVHGREEVDVRALVSSGLSLFGKTPELMACWKINKMMNSLPF
jgi:hypothetical protein